MSLCRVGVAGKFVSQQLASRSVLTSLGSASVFRRYFWWSRKSNGEDKGKKVEKKNDDKEKKKLEVPSFGTKDQTKAIKESSVTPSFNDKKLSEDLDKYSDSLLRNDPSRGVIDDIADLGPIQKIGRDPYKTFQEFMTPRPVRLHNEMVIPAIPLPVRPLLPGFMQNLTISDRATIQKLREVQASSDRYVGLFLRREKSSNDLADNPDVIRSLSDIYSVGTYEWTDSLISRCAELQDIRMVGTNASVILLGRSRISIKDCVQLGPPTLIKADRIPPPVNDLDEVTMNAYANEIFSYTQLIAASNPILNEYLTLFMQRRETDNPLYFADFAGGLTMEHRELQQKLLESRSFPERFEIAIKLFSQELQTIRIQQELKKKVEANTKETERKFILKEQMKVIQQQLGGDKDPKQSYIDKINTKLEDMKNRKVSEAAITVAFLIQYEE